MRRAVHVCARFGVPAVYDRRKVLALSGLALQALLHALEQRHSLLLKLRPRLERALDRQLARVHRGAGAGRL
jgi:hypothetical protein